MVEKPKSAKDFLDDNPLLRKAMSGSAIMKSIKDNSLVDVDGERLYVVQGDALGAEEDLYLDALAKGVAGQGESYTALFRELDEGLQKKVVQRFEKRDE